jgi:extradiol dioxygenase family protein
MKNPFHLAIPVHNLKKAADFYEHILKCKRGRENNSWIDFNLFGHQLVCHLVENLDETNSNLVDGDAIPIPHFGVVLNFDQFDELANKLIEQKINFIHKPKIRFSGMAGEQRIMFIKDPSGNAIEFKAFKDLNSLFESK